MKRYFDIAGKATTLEIDVTKKGQSYTVQELEETLGVEYLREVDKKEYKKLNKKYDN